MELKSQYVFSLYVNLAPAIDFGSTFNGDRRYIPITGGHFAGPGIKGEIMPTGEDWNVVRSDGVVHIYARYSLRTDDGVAIVITNEGYGRASQEEMTMVFDETFKIDPQAAEATKKTWHTKIWPRFEVAPGPYDWMNESFFVGDLVQPTGPESVQVDVYQLL